MCSSTITISPSTLPIGTQNTAYSQTLTASGGTAPYAFAATSGGLPPGLALSGSGTLSGTPTTPGSYTFTVTVSDAGGCTGSQSYTLQINCPSGWITCGMTCGCGACGSPCPTGDVCVSNACACPSITISPTSLPNGIATLAYPTQTLTASGGTAPYTFAVTSGSLPPGLTLSSSGVLSGGTTTAGTYTFTVTATATGRCTGSATYTIVVSPPTACSAVTVSPSTLPSGTAGTAYSQTITASGGTAPYTFLISGGSLPPGLMLSSGGSLTGTPTTAGSYSFTVTARDSKGCPGGQSYTLGIAAACSTITVSPSTLPGGTVGVPYSQTLTASGGTAPYTFTTDSAPPGLALSSSGTLSGTPTTAGTFTVSELVTDAHGCSGVASVTITLSPATCPTITLGPSTLPGGTIGAAYSQTITASGGTAPYTFLVSGGSLPPGLSLASAGALSGTPTALGSSTFTVSATDSHGCTGSQSYTVAIGCPAGLTACGSSCVDTSTDPRNCSGCGIVCPSGRICSSAMCVCPAISVSPSTLTDGTAGMAYSQTLGASGGTGSYTFAVSSGALPAGVSLSSADVLSGTPNAGGNFAFTVTATDSAGCTGSQSYSLVIRCPAIALAPASLPGGKVKSAYDQSITASGGTAPYLFTVTSGSLPAGLSLSASGTLSGTPTAVGTASFTVTAVDADSCRGSGSYTLAIAPQPDSAVPDGGSKPDSATPEARVVPDAAPPRPDATGAREASGKADAMRTPADAAPARDARTVDMTPANLVDAQADAQGTIPGPQQPHACGCTIGGRRSDAPAGGLLALGLGLFVLVGTRRRRRG